MPNFRSDTLTSDPAPDTHASNTANSNAFSQAQPSTHATTNTQAESEPDCIQLNNCVDCNCQPDHNDDGLPTYNQ